jgi:hypothetical protein
MAFWKVRSGKDARSPLIAEPGLLIAFPSDKWHEVKPVSHGRRFTVVTWFHALEVPAEAEGGSPRTDSAKQDTPPEI